MPVSIIIPFHRNLQHLNLSVTAARQSMPEAEILIAADGAMDDCHPLAAEQRALVIDVEGPSGPATARNRAAARATGDLLIFVDADVVVAADALPRLSGLFDAQPALAGAFGAYDLAPPEPNFMSQFKNLSHARIHEVGAGGASTFWAGLGAMRASVFRSVGGFDERFHRPSVEDIDLGYRVSTQGHRLLLDPAIRGRHLKRWTLGSSIVTEVTARGIPWVQLLRRYAPRSNELNLSAALRASVVVAYVLLLATIGTWFSPWSAGVAVAAVIALIALNFDYYRWFARQRGLLFAVRVVPAHAIHHLCNGLSFVLGVALHLVSKSGWRLPGALPADPWRAPNRASGMDTQR